MQQLNLLNPALRPPRHRLTLATLLGALALIVAGLGVSSLVTVHKASQLEQQLKEAEAQHRTLQARADLLTTQARRGPDAGLAALLLRTKARLSATHEVLAALDSGNGGENAGYSSILAGLARQSLNGVWLTGVGGAGLALDIRGRLLNANLMPEYLRRLQEDGAFHGHRFGNLVLQDHPEEIKAKGDANGVSTGEARPEVAEPGPHRYVEFNLQAYAVSSTDKPSGGAGAGGTPPSPQPHPATTAAGKEQP